MASSPSGKGERQFFTVSADKLGRQSIRNAGNAVLFFRQCCASICRQCNGFIIQRNNDLGIDGAVITAALREGQGRIGKLLVLIDRRIHGIRH